MVTSMLVTGVGDQMCWRQLKDMLAPTFKGCYQHRNLVTNIYRHQLEGTNITVALMLMMDIGDG